MLHFRIGIACCLISLNIQAQYVYMKQFTTKDGLPSNTVNDVLQDDDGFIWFATDQGVSQFDGHHFTNFTSQAGIADDEIIRLGKDHEGRIWFMGFNGKASYCLKGKFYDEKNSVLASQTQLNSVFTKFLISKTGTVYLISNTDGFLQVRGDQVKKFSSDTLLKRFGIKYVNGLRSVKLDVADALWIFTEDTAFIFRDGNMRLPEHLKMPLSNHMFYAFFLSDSSWIIPAEEKLIRYLKNEKDSIVGLPLQSPVGYISVEEDAYNNLWLMTSEGACFFRDKKLDYQHQVKILDNKYTAHVFTDHEGNTWLLPLRDGVFMIPSLEVRFLNTINGLANNNVLVLADHPQGVIAGFANGTVQLIRTNGNLISPENAVSVGSYMVGILPNGKNNWLFLTNAEVIRGDKDFKIMEKKSLTWAKSYLLRSNGSLLIGGGFDLSELQNDKLSKLFHFPRENRIYSIAEDHQHVVWLGTEQGLHSFHNAQMEFLGEKFPQVKERINDLEFDPFGRLWIASNKGLLLMEGDTVKSLIGENHDEKISVYKILMDSGGVVYTGTDKGIFIFKEGNTGNFQITRIGKADGLVSEKINTILVKEGMIWIGTDEGLQIFPVNQKMPAISSVPVRLTAFTINGKPFPGDTTLSLSYDQNTIHISYAGLCFREPQSVIYRYKIKVVDSIWQYTSNSSLDLPQLSSGNYRILVQAATSKSNWSSAPLQLSFTIHSPYWKKGWFYAGLIAVLAATVFFAFRYRYKQKLEKEEQKRKSVEAELAALRSQMNPHFIFNSLNAIQDFIFQHKTEEANEYLSKFAKLIRSILNQSRKQFATIEEECDLLRIYLELESLRFNNAFEWEMKIGDGIITSEMLIPSMLLQPVVENSIKHGFKNLKRKGMLRISFEKENSVIRCEVEDNGIGRSEGKNTDGKSHALSITTERLIMLNHSLRLPCTMEVTDIFTNSDIAGLKTVFRFPENITQ